MDVSAIIPTSGHRPRYLNEAISSVWAQKFRPRELIVVVDGTSSDLARVQREIVSAGTPQPVLISTGAPVGVSVARNLGAEAASHEMLAYLDDDDLWRQEHLQAFHGFEIDIGLSAFLKLRSDGTLVPEKTPPAHLHPRRFLVSNPGLRGSNLVIRRAVLRRIQGFRSSLRALNDLDLGIRLSEIPGLRYRRVSERLVVFRAHDQRRLTTAYSESIDQGVREFWRLYRSRMTDEERLRFVDRAYLLWRITNLEMI